MLDRVDHRDKVVIGSFFVYDEWILLCISLECYLFAEVSHTIDMEHPELIDSCESETSLELCELLLSATIAKCLDFSCEECLSRRDQ